ncbi:hypothetical protein HPT25_04995 [Bacillus sp. BRMEA1]|uniref:hypothetical protein n=1 Tax=Neobacillus endophyticus TaxID=2738405 RepID=UPI00156525E2|nr:hypothetical protein [Neobacillus endophyticus]NRD76848.1 hypothetical protein [Neobacillus endophyticus]
MNTSDILPGDILFVWGRGIFSEAIEMVTGGPSHCALFLDKQTLAEAQSGRDSGIAYLSTYLNSGGHLEVWRDETLTKQERKRITAYAKNHFGIQYDYTAILAELVRFKLDIPIYSFQEGNRRICSSFLNDCAKSVGRNWANIPYTPAPVDLINSGKLTKIGEL